MLAGEDFRGESEDLLPLRSRPLPATEPSLLDRVHALPVGDDRLGPEHIDARPETILSNRALIVSHRERILSATLCLLSHPL
jgi:hypothetical protein